MFNRQELEYLYVAVNQLPPPNSTENGRSKGYMITKLCNLMDELDKQEAEKENETEESKSEPKASGKSKGSNTSK